MTAKADLELGAAVQVMCFTYSNPDSINGPFGDLELAVDASGNTTGTMTLNLLFGLPSKAKLNLTGACQGDQTHTCKLKGSGYITKFGQKPQKIELDVKLTMDAGWQKGELAFSQAMPEVTGGLPTTRTVCHS